MPCQKDFGSCQIKTGKTCGVGSGSTNGRTIGYYQGSNTRDRLCNHIYPADIISTGYTHLYYAFASIDPTSFAVLASDPGDVALFSQFTALKSRGLQTWIAVGGFDFSDANKPTHGTWYVFGRAWTVDMQNLSTNVNSQEQTCFNLCQSCGFHHLTEDIHGQIWVPGSRSRLGVSRRP